MGEPNSAGQPSRPRPASSAAGTGPGSAPQRDSSAAHPLHRLATGRGPRRRAPHRRCSPAPRRRRRRPAPGPPRRAGSARRAAGRSPRVRDDRQRPRTVNPRLASTTTLTNSSTSASDGTSDGRGPPQRSLGAQPCPATRRTASSQSAPPRSSGSVGRRGSTTATTSSGHELRHPLQPDRVDVGGRGGLDGAGGEQAGPGEHRGQRLRHRAQPGVDDQRHVDRPRRAGPGQLRHERGQPGDRADQLPDEPAVAAVADGQVAGDDRVDAGRVRARRQQAGVVDEVGEQRRDGQRVRWVGRGPVVTVRTLTAGREPTATG